jgi:hypothetical protein
VSDQGTWHMSAPVDPADVLAGTKYISCVEGEVKQLLQCGEGMPQLVAALRPCTSARFMLRPGQRLLADLEPLMVLSGDSRSLAPTLTPAHPAAAPPSC